MARIRYGSVTILLFLGGLTADFTPLSLFLSLQVSDVLLIGAGLLAIPIGLSNVPAAVIRLLRTNLRFAILAALGALFLCATAVSTIVAALSPHVSSAKTYSLIESRSFEHGLRGVGGNRASVARTTAAAKLGVYGLRVSPRVRTVNAGAFVARAAAVPKTQYRLSVWVRAPVDVTITVRIDWYGEGRFLQSSSMEAKGTERFARVAVNGRAPPRARRAQPVFYIASASRKPFYLDEVRFAQLVLPTDVGVRAGAETWLLFAMLFGVVVPLIAVAVAVHPRALASLSAGLVVGATLGAVGYVIEAAAAGESFFSGARDAGIFGSDPFFLLLVGLAILLSHFTSSFVRPDSVPLPNRLLFAWALRALEGASILIIVLALIVSRYRAGWIGAACVLLVVLVLITRDARAVALTLAAIFVVLFSVYRLGGLPDPLTARINQTFDLSQPDVKARREAARRLFNAWTARPWGVGLDRSPEYLPPKLVEGRNPAVHNLVGHALVEGGPLAALAMAVFPFLLTMLWVYRDGAETSRDWRGVGLFAAMWGCVAAAYLSPTLYQRAAWATVGALIGWSARPARERTGG